MNRSPCFASATVLLLLSATCIWACGSHEGSPMSGTGGARSTGGRVATDGASGGSASNSLVAAMSLNFLSGGVNCPFLPGYDDFPVVTGSHPVSDVGAMSTTPDNVTSSRGLVTLECTVRGALRGVSITLGGGSMSMGFHASGSGTSSGNLQYTALNSTVSYHGTSAAPCIINVISITDTGGLYSINCPTFMGDDGSSCVLGNSYVYFNGCSLN